MNCWIRVESGGAARQIPDRALSESSWMAESVQAPEIRIEEDQTDFENDVQAQTDAGL